MNGLAPLVRYRNSDSLFEQIAEQDLANQTASDLTDLTMQTKTNVEHTENEQPELFRKSHNKDLLIAHLNINSIQNKFEELTENIRRLNTQISFCE